jgi:hypothetical protein
MFFENCGRFLYRYDESRDRLLFLISILSNKLKNCTSNDLINKHIESCIAYTLMDPHDFECQQSRKPELQEYLEYLLSLSPGESEQVVQEEILRLPWAKEGLRLMDYLAELIPNMKVEQYHFICAVVGSLQDYYPRVVIHLLDSVLETV